MKMAISLETARVLLDEIIVSPFVDFDWFWSNVFYLWELKVAAPEEFINGLFDCVYEELYTNAQYVDRGVAEILIGKLDRAVVLVEPILNAVLKDEYVEQSYSIESVRLLNKELVVLDIVIHRVPPIIRPNTSLYDDYRNRQSYKRIAS